ncbi:hypothetical protein [Sulfurimonas xiamenensis]|uniref:Uncharacterized protein n=1 Tax=Sulfurimonas xiamenensis TaxID=2590021 RepID=A0AAJ4A3U2_9BACT|nr:hypothetical protein [Sulfurimonas xiamenensis]QFR43444.1 hypothetical protein FJR47_05820 [Sulfurimonas xiamenensis]
MNNSLKNIQDTQLCNNIDKLLSEGDSFLEKNLSDLKISSYCYQINEAVNELSLEEEIINELIEDYVIQILKSTIFFYKHIQELKKNKLENRPLNYINIRNLAHKNLGVARNLHIKDAEKLLKLIMNENDLESLEIYIKALEITAIKLNPLCAYETLNLIKAKNFL